MLSQGSKKTVSANIFTNCLKGFADIASKHMQKAYVTDWESFIDSANQDFQYGVDKCKFIYDSFPMLKDDPHYVELYDRLNNWTPLQIFQLYGQPEPLPAIFYFNEFRFQTKEEAEQSNKLMLEILSEL